jgi:hypothetical protein
MADAMRTLARETQALEHDEQHLLALAYRNLLQPTRNAWHTISSLLPSPSSSSSTSACATIGTDPIAIAQVEAGWLIIMCAHRRQAGVDQAVPGQARG